MPHIDDIAEFIAQLFHSSTVTHLLHLSTDSYSKHKALGKYYPQIVELTDKFAENFQGKYEKIKVYPEEFHSATDPIAYLQGIQAFVTEARVSLPEDTELQNIVDEIAELINSTLYRLRFLE